MTNDLFRQLSRFLQDANVTKILRFGHISAQQRDHLFRVYASLLVGLLLGAAGCYTGEFVFRWNLMGPSTLCLLGTVLFILSSLGMLSTMNSTEGHYGTITNKVRSQYVSVRYKSSFKGMSVDTATYYGLSAYTVGLSLSSLVILTAAINLRKQDSMI